MDDAAALYQASELWKDIEAKAEMEDENELRWFAMRARSLFETLRRLDEERRTGCATTWRDVRALRK